MSSNQSRYQKAYFLLSVADVKQLPPDQGTEVAIVGRSNAGKSSVLNRLTQQKSLARVSKTPGRTQMINMFALDEKHRLADLPGYGFAKVPLTEKEKWEKLISAYFAKRHSLKGLLLVMDIRHPLKDTDLMLLEMAENQQIPVHVLLNKSDKLSKNAVIKVVNTVKVVLTEYDNAVSFQSFSAQNSEGLSELFATLDVWYNFKK